MTIHLNTVTTIAAEIGLDFTASKLRALLCILTAVLGTAKLRGDRE